MSTVVEVRLVPAPPPTASAGTAGTTTTTGGAALPSGGSAGAAAAGGAAAAEPAAPPGPAGARCDPAAPATPTGPGGAGGARRTAAVPVRHHRPDRSRARTGATPARPPVVERLDGAGVTAYSHAAPQRLPTEPVPVPALPPGSPAGAAATLDPRQACCMVALAAVEVLAGTRPLAQLARWVTPEVYDELARRAALTAPRSRVLDPVAAPADLAGRTEGPLRRPSVRRVRAVAVGRDALEASVVVAHAGRVRAVAVRLTRVAGRWRAAALVVG